jgi:hypothetical protein
LGVLPLPTDLLSDYEIRPKPRGLPGVFEKARLSRAYKSFLRALLDKPKLSTSGIALADIFLFPSKFQ